MLCERSVKTRIESGRKQTRKVIEKGGSIMRILSQTNDIKGYHGTIGTPTNMYDYRGEQLFVGDVVCLTTFGVDGKKEYDFGIEFVCEENIDIANYTGKNHQYVMGIANTYNNEKFKVRFNESVQMIKQMSEEFRAYNEYLQRQCDILDQYKGNHLNL